MTEPIDESEMASDQGSTEPATEVVAEAQDAGEAAPPTGEAPPEAQSTAWVPPSDGGDGGGGLRRGCVIALLVVAVGVLAVLVGLTFLGSQLASSLAGTMEFGTGGTGCSVTGEATTFPASSAIHAVAYLERETRAGEPITITVTYPNGTKESQDQTVGEGSTCISQDVPSGVAPGHYLLEYRSGAEVLATGAFDITP